MSGHLLDHEMLEIMALSCVDAPWGLGFEHLNITEASDPYYRFLFSAAYFLQPKVIVECGTYLGIAAEHMAIAVQNIPDAIVITIDEKVTDRAVKAVNMHDGKIFLIHGDTVLSAQHVYDYCDLHNFRIGLLFLDSTHDSYTPKREYEAYLPYFEDECLVCCDDIGDPNNREFWDWLPGDKMELNMLHMAKYPGYPNPGFGISIVRR